MNDNSSTYPSMSAETSARTAEAIARRAYDLWERDGRPDGRDQEHWLRAEQELIAEQSNREDVTSAASPIATPGSLVQSTADHEAVTLRGNGDSVLHPPSNSARRGSKRTGGTPPVPASKGSPSRVTPSRGAGK